MATALKGNSPFNVDSLSNLPLSQIFTDSLVSKTTNYRDTANKCVEVNTTFFVVDANSTQDFFYKTTLGEFGSACLPNLCFDCLYSLDLSIKNDCGVEVFDYDLSNALGLDTIIGGAPPYNGGLCDGVKNIQLTGGALNTPITLNFSMPGTYSLYKKICVSDAPLEDYTAEFLRKQSCKAPCHFVDSLVNAADFSGCEPQNCEDCLNSISIYTLTADSAKHKNQFNEYGEHIDPNYTGPLFPQLTPQQLSAKLEACQKLCAPATECQKQEEMLLADFYPGTGQYAQTDPSDPRWTGSIMNPTNTLFSGYDWMSPTTYVRADGSLDYVQVNGANVGPQALSSADYQSNYKKSWAKAFLTKHPDYCKLYFTCNVLGATLDYDEQLKDLAHYDTVCTSGLIYPLGTLPGTVIAPPASGCGSPVADPIFTTLSGNANVIALKNQLLNNLYGNTSQSLYHYVALQFVSPLPGGYLFGQDECSRDAMWNMFRSIYLTKKQRLYEVLETAYLSNPSAFGYPVGATCYDHPPEGYRTHFPDILGSVFEGQPDAKAQIRNIIDNNNQVALTNLGNAYHAAANATMAAHSASTCAGYEALWRMNLNMACSAFSSANSTKQDSIIAAMKGVCEKGSTFNNPDGASTVVSGNPYLIMPGSIAVNSFQEVLDYYLGVNACFSGIISLPPPYPFNTPVYSGGNALGSCHCDQVLQNAANFQTLSSSSSLPLGVTTEWQLFRKVNGFDLQEYYALKCFCNGAVASSPGNSPWAPGLVWDNTQLTSLATYPAPANPKMECSTCVKCSDVVAAIDNLVLPSAASAFSWKIDKIVNDSVNTYYSLAKLNSQFGSHNLLYYLDLYEDCKTFNSANSDTTNTFKHNVTPEALDLFNYLNQLVEKRNLENNNRALSICEDDKYYLSGIYEGSLPTLNPMTYNYNIVGNTLSFNLQIPGPTNILSVALTLPGAYTGTWDDLRQLSNFVAWCPSPASGPNYGFKVLATDALFNTVTVQGVITNMAFPISYLSSGGSPVPASCPKKPKKLNTCAITLFNNALVQGRMLFDQHAQQLATDFQSQYKNHCFNSLKETFYRKYKFVREYNYTLYYYDEAGNLQRTVAPNGVEPLAIGTDLPASPVVYPNHSLGANIVNQKYVSDYRFNSYNQPVTEKTVDGGLTKYMYDLNGRIILSQNAKQAAMTNTFVYSYTLYDAMSRITEVGEMVSSVNVFSVSGVHSIPYLNYTAIVAGASVRRQVSRTYYDNSIAFPSAPAAIYFAVPENVQQNLRNRVVAVTYVETLSGNAYELASFYSYDDHGNVKFLVQENNTLGSNLSGAASGYNMQFKRVDYDYDLISGNMLQAGYQVGHPDHLSHKYYYDADNRLKEVFTTKDGINWDRDAKYFYYEHGPLARVERADKKVQGTDFYYTIHGWLKGVNSDILQPNNDAGKDGAPTSIYASNYDKIHGYFAKDAMAFALNYYNNTDLMGTHVDYQAIKNADYNGTTDITPLSSLTNLYSNAAPFYLDYNGAGDGASLFNGNISSMVTSFIDKNPGNTITDNTPFPQLTAYRYDQLHRITAQKAHRSITGNSWNAASGSNYYSAYKMNLTYDRNGNILSLFRNGTDGALVSGSNVLMDSLRYRYKTVGNSASVNSNQLYGIFDAASASAYTEDIEAPASPVAYNGSTDRYAYDQIGNLIKDAGEYIDSIEWTVDRKVRIITRDAAAMLLTGTGAGSAYKPDIEYVYNSMRQRVIKIVKPRDQVTKALKPQTDWRYTYYVHDASGNVMAVYDRKTTVVSGHYTVSLGLGEHHIYGSERLALSRPAKPVEWGYHSYPCGGEGDNTNCRTIASTYVPASGRAERHLGYKEFELNNHLGNVIATVSDRKVYNTGITMSYFFNAPNDQQGWLGSYPLVSVSGGWMTLTTGTAYAALAKYITTVPGKTYRVRYNLWNPAGCAVEGEVYPVPVTPPFLINVAAAPGVGPNVNEFVFTATTAQSVIRIQRAMDGVGSAPFHVGYVTIEEIVDYSADILMHTDYYSFGQSMPGRSWTASDYRYGFNGKEGDKEVSSGFQDYGFRVNDTRIGRFFSVDPLAPYYPELTPYQFASNRPIDGVDLDGLEWKDAKGKLMTSAQLKKVKVYIFNYTSYEGDRNQGFTNQTLQQYADLTEELGEGSVAISDLTTEQQFAEDWANIDGEVSIVRINSHGTNQAIFLRAVNDEYLTSTGNGKTPMGADAFNIKNLSQPKGDISKARLELNTCHSYQQTPDMTGSKQTVAESFAKRFGFSSIRATENSVSYNGSTPFPSNHDWNNPFMRWAMGSWTYLYPTFQMPSKSPAPADATGTKPTGGIYHSTRTMPQPESSRRTDFLSQE
jgi:RHS repeat-associated protein